MERPGTSSRAGIVSRLLGDPAACFAARVRGLQVAVVVMTLIFAIGTMFRGPGHSTFFDVYLYYGILCGSALLSFSRWHLVRDRERGAWLALAIGMSVWTAGEAFWTVAYADASNPPAVSL